MKLKITLLIAAFVSLFANAIYAGRASDGNAKIIYWQAPSILNPYLSSGTKDIESASLVIEPLGRYDEKGALVPWLAEEIPTVGNGGVSSDLTTITWKLKKGLLWSDGSAVTSADVKFTADYCMDPDEGGDEGRGDQACARQSTDLDEGPLVHVKGSVVEFQAARP